MKNLTRQAFACLFILAATSCNSDAPKDMKKSTYPDRIVSNVVHPDWVENASIYEVNIRQYTVEGTFNDFAEHLSRLKELGVDILWFMPIHPIGEKNRKGSLGSYYSVRDYTAVNPEFGSLEDFKRLVEMVHEQGMYAIIDWVPNHTAWDHVWTIGHPEYYVKDEDGGFVSPFDWTDVIQLDYENEEMRKDMIASMEYWLTETGIDGFRCDVAHMVPVDFWDEVRPALEAIKPVFLLAESDQYFLQENAFDATYGWPFHHLMNDIAAGRKTANAISYHFSKIDSLFPEGSIIMQFTSNHDENSWNGTVWERLNGGVKTFAVLAATVPGMPLIYSGQEAGLDKRLQFFENDPIDWKEHEMFPFYQTLLSLKKRNEALWNGSSGGGLTRVTSTDNKSVYAFLREKGEYRVLVILNLTGQPVTVSLRGRKHAGSYTDVFSGEAVTFKSGTELELNAWEYRVYEQ